MLIRAKSAADQAWIEHFLVERWGGPILLAGRLVDAAALPALIAGDREGLATFAIDGRQAQLVTLNAVEPRRGIGTALVAALVERLRANGVARLVVTTTNDNIDALRFYQRRGFRLVAVRPGAVEAARALKPSLPEIGAHGIPLRDEIELDLRLQV